MTGAETVTKSAAIVMAGGTSQRMRAGGTSEHKALRKVCGRTLLEHNLESLHVHGFHDIAVAVSAREPDVRRWLELDGAEWAGRRNSNLRLLVEDEPLGTIGCVRRLAACAENALVVNVDNLTELDLRAFFDFHVNEAAALTVATHVERFRIPFGQVDVAGSRVIAIREKPELPVTISSGTYVLHRRAMLRIPQQGKTHAPDLIEELLLSGEIVAAFEHSAWWIDVNDEQALKLAEAALARKARASCLAQS